MAIIDYGKVCHHGSLKRKCDYCEKDAEIATLKRVIEIQGEALRKMKDMECIRLSDCPENCRCSTYADMADEVLTKSKELLDGK